MLWFTYSRSTFTMSHWCNTVFSWLTHCCRVCHTTRRRQVEEVHGKDFKFVSIDEFEELIKIGCFLQTNMYNGQWYGLSSDSIEAVAGEGLAAVVNMELEVSGSTNKYTWPWFDRFAKLLVHISQCIETNSLSLGSFSAHILFFEGSADTEEDAFRTKVCADTANESRSSRKKTSVSWYVLRWAHCRYPQENRLVHRLQSRAPWLLRLYD